MKAMKYEYNGPFQEPCQKILKAHSQNKIAYLLLNPVDTREFPDYNIRIPRPIDFSTIRKKLETNVYSAPQEFANDMRRIYGNLFRYNPDPRYKNLRREAKTYLLAFELDWNSAFPGLHPVRRHLNSPVKTIVMHFKLDVLGF